MDIANKIDQIVVVSSMALLAVVLGVGYSDRAKALQVMDLYNQKVAQYAQIQQGAPFVIDRGTELKFGICLAAQNQGWNVYTREDGKYVERGSDMQEVGISELENALNNLDPKTCK